MSEIEPPNPNWAEVIINTNRISELDSSYSDCSEKLIEWYQTLYEDGPTEIETPESVAIQIGTHAEITHPDYFDPIFSNSLDSNCEKQLARGYIGAKTITDASSD